MQSLRNDSIVSRWNVEWSALKKPTSLRGKLCGFVSLKSRSDFLVNHIDCPSPFRPIDQVNAHDDEHKADEE